MQDIKSYLKCHENKEMLRFITCGSVDDGKSTLIGRLLYDSKMIFDDQLSAIKKDSKKFGTTGESLDLALLVDGLASEREQGITIDVAYRYFSTDKRKFIIADTPGHEQYTRNMVTGASTADLAIILIDARQGVLTQTKRHSYIVSLLGIKNIIVAINKMDLVNFSQEKFQEIKKEYESIIKNLVNHDNIVFTYIPISALNGDNIVNLSQSSSWYKDKTLMELLNTIKLNSDESLNNNFRFPVQYVNRPNLNFRGFCGTVASGKVRINDEITILPSGKTTRVKAILSNNGEIDEAFSKMAITLTTVDEIDISRGDMIVHAKALPKVSNSLKVMLVWMDEESMQTHKNYDIKRSTSTLVGSFEHINYKIDINTYKRQEVNELALNDIASCKMLLTRPLAVDNYSQNRQTGSFIVIDRVSNNTVGAGMIVDVTKRDETSHNTSNLFNIWNNQKQILQKNVVKRSFEQRDIIFVKMGKNIGFEQDGKGEDFLRPVLVFKKFNHNQFIGFAMTSKYHKQEKFYYKLKEDSYIVLSQIKTYSSKRISHKIGRISKKTLEKIYMKFNELITP